VSDKEQAKVSRHIEGKYTVVGVFPGPIHTKKYGTVDLRSISESMAEKLVKEGFRYLKKVESKPASTK
jgi:hypothetical protein